MTVNLVELLLGYTFFAIRFEILRRNLIKALPGVIYFQLISLLALMKMFSMELEYVHY